MWGSKPVVSSEADSAGAGSAQTFTFVAQSVELKTSAATVDYDVTTATSTCTGTCCAGVLPYAVAQPGWPLPKGATRVDTLDDSITNTPPGKVTLNPVVVGVAVEPNVPCAAAALLTANPRPVTGVTVVSPLSATLGKLLEAEVLFVCKPTYQTGVSLAAGADGAREVLSFQPSAFVAIEKSFDATGVETATQTVGWSTLTNTAIAACP
jgi:hypothetical protein